MSSLHCYLNIPYKHCIYWGILEYAPKRFVREFWLFSWLLRLLRCSTRKRYIYVARYIFVAYWYINIRDCGRLLKVRPRPAEILDFSPGSTYKSRIHCNLGVDPGFKCGSWTEIQALCVDPGPKSRIYVWIQVVLRLQPPCIHNYINTKHIQK